MCIWNLYPTDDLGGGGGGGGGGIFLAVSNLCVLKGPKC